MNIMGAYIRREVLFCSISKVKTWHHFTSVFWSFVLIKNYGQDIDHHCMPHGTHKYVPNSEQARNVISHTCKRVKRFVFECDEVERNRATKLSLNLSSWEFF